MEQTTLRDKARLLLSRRNATIGIGFYLRQTAWRHVLFTAMFAVLAGLAWSAEVYPLAYIVGGFWAGRLLRDIQWFQSLSGEWQTSREFIDWQKVERIASDPTP